MYRPQTSEQFRRLSGVGERKLDLYGADFMRVIEEHEQPPEEVASQAEESVLLYKTGMTVDQVARQQHLSANAIYAHLAQGIQCKELAVSDVVELPAGEMQQIEQAIIACQEEFGQALKPVSELLAGAYEMGVLRCVKAGMEQL